MKNLCQKVKTDSDILEELIANAEDGIAVIPQRKCEAEPNRNYWLIDRAILIPENTTVILRNCKIKLSDKCRDNFFRSANCTGEIGREIQTLKNIHIIGEGYAVLEGADHPRSTGDAGKVLKCPCYKTEEELLRYADWLPQEEVAAGKLSFSTMHDFSYGTDANVEGEYGMGNWRNIGVLLVCVENFSIENIHIVEAHGWSISLENCAYGRVENIEFNAKMQREIDGILHNVENQDGLDLRNGCHDIIVSNITGQTGDDLVALTAVANPRMPVRENGALNSTHYMHNDWSKRDPCIHNITLRNLMGRSQGGAIVGACAVLRLLATELAKIYDVIVDGVTAIHYDGLREKSTLVIGSADSNYGRCYPDGIRNISISNVICDSKKGFSVNGYLKDSVICNVVNKNPNGETFGVARENGLQNVQICNVVTVGK